MPKDAGASVVVDIHRLATCSYTLHTESLYLEVLHQIVSRNRAGLVEVWPVKIVCKAILLAGSLWKVELRLRQTGLLLRELEDPKREETESNQITSNYCQLCQQLPKTKDQMKGFIGFEAIKKGRCVFSDRFDSSSFLKDRKKAAVQNEDYDAAKALKSEIDRLRSAIDRPPERPMERLERPQSGRTQMP